jgi:hypothetical protein
MSKSSDLECGTVIAATDSRFHFHSPLLRPPTGRTEISLTRLIRAKCLGSVRLFAFVPAWNLPKGPCEASIFQVTGDSAKILLVPGSWS